MAQWVKVPTTKPEDLSLILGFHMIEGESQPQQVLYVMKCVCVQNFEIYLLKEVSFYTTLISDIHTNPLLRKGSSERRKERGCLQRLVGVLQVQSLDVLHVN